MARSKKAKSRTSQRQHNQPKRGERSKPTSNNPLNIQPFKQEPKTRRILTLINKYRANITRSKRRRFDYSIGKTNHSSD